MEGGTGARDGVGANSLSVVQIGYSLTRNLYAASPHPNCLRLLPSLATPVPVPARASLASESAWRLHTGVGRMDGFHTHIHNIHIHVYICIYIYIIYVLCWWEYFHSTILLRIKKVTEMVVLYIYSS